MLIRGGGGGYREGGLNRALIELNSIVIPTIGYC